MFDQIEAQYDADKDHSWNDEAVVAYEYREIQNTICDLQRRMSRLEDNPYGLTAEYFALEERIADLNEDILDPKFETLRQADRKLLIESDDWNEIPF